MTELTNEEWMVIQRLRQTEAGLIYISVDEGKPYQLIEVPVLIKQDDNR